MRPLGSWDWPDVTELVTRGQATARVPATSANLGPGYDALGLALGLYDDVTARVIGTGLTIAATGQGATDVPRDESHLIVRAMRATFAALDVSVTGLALDCTNRIPHGRGLGSSAAAICAGVLLARRLVSDGEDRLDAAGTLALAGQLEGHPDNVAPCLLGGLTVAWSAGDDDGGARAVRVDPLPTIGPVVFVPPFESSTEQARRLLPAEIAHRDAAFNRPICTAGCCPDQRPRRVAGRDRGPPAPIVSCTGDAAERGIGRSAARGRRGRGRLRGRPVRARADRRPRRPSPCTRLRPGRLARHRIDDRPSWGDSHIRLKITFSRRSRGDTGYDTPRGGVVSEGMGVYALSSHEPSDAHRPDARRQTPGLFPAKGSNQLPACSRLLAPNPADSIGT